MPDREKENIPTLANEFEEERTGAAWGIWKIALRIAILAGFFVALFAVYTLLEATGVIGPEAVADDQPLFTDVGVDDPRREAVEFVVGEGLMSGVSTDVFAPDNPVSRADFARIVVETMGWEVEPDLDAGFSDVEGRAFLDEADYIATVVEHEVMQGSGELGEFRPEEETQLAHAIVVFVRAARAELPQPQPEVPDDIGALAHSEAMKDALAVVEVNGLLQGSSVDLLTEDLTRPVTRGELAVLTGNVRLQITE